MGGAMTIGLLMMAFGEMSERRWGSVGARGSGYACLNDSPGPEVQTLLVGVQRTDDSGGGEVGGLRVSYRRWGGLKGTLPPEDGTVGASGPWNVESWGEEALGLGSRDNEGSVWPPLMRAMFEMGWEVKVASSNGWSRDVQWREDRWKLRRRKVIKDFAMWNGVCELKAGTRGL